MSKFVAVHKLSKAFKGWEHQYSSIKGMSRSLPFMTDEFNNWLHENEELIHKVHTEKDYLMDHIIVVFEFHNEEEALICRLRFG